MHYETKSLVANPVANIGKVVLMLLVIGLVTSCGKKHGDDKASQSIVRVNGDEITVLQINNELQRANVQPGQQEAAGKQITQALVDRQILVQEALKTKLDRNPRVMQAIENAKTQILAQAYLEDKVASLAKPTSADITNYRAKHVDIFANRKIYITDEIAFAIEAGHSEELQSLSKSAKSVKDVTQWLGAHQIKFELTRAAHAAETLPPPLLAKFGQMAVGDLIYINANGNNGRTMAVSLSEIKDVPISEKDSTPLIERIISEEKRKQTAEAEMKRLRSAAKIEYINKKFDPTADAKPVETKPVEATKPAADAKSVDSQKTQSNIAKGLSGL
jgi:EpsD family peptidyl-prolyl cis-trans isomerase